MKISIIIPCYNARDKIEGCVNYFRSFNFVANEFELIFVDDFSSDETFDYVQIVCQSEPNWSAYRLNSNSGSPSKPKNYGTQKATGDYIVYLELGDVVHFNILNMCHSFAVSKDACVVMGHLVYGELDGGWRIINEFKAVDGGKSRKNYIRDVLSSESDIEVILIKREFIREQELCWNEEILKGLKEIFLIDLMIQSNSIYNVQYSINRLDGENTHKKKENFNGQDISNYIRSWMKLENRINSIGLSYYEVRLHKAISAMLRTIIFNNYHDIDGETFHKFGKFLKTIWNQLNKRGFDPHQLEILDALYRNDYSVFLHACKPRLLIAGHELKFILPFVEALRSHFNIRIDEWKGFEIHDEQKSWRLLEWAEYIWCEWLLGNAVWYSVNKFDHQKLVVRMHRMELEKNYGEFLNERALDAIVAVSVLFFERLLQRFTHLPRHKVRLIPNSSWLGEKDSRPVPDRLFKLAAVGIVPSRKGFSQMLRVLVALRRMDSRYSLDVFGYGPEHYTWINRDREEARYFNECRKFIRKNGLSDYVNFVGYAKMPETLFDRKIGFVLSTSISGDFPGFESFHLAVLDGFAGGGQGVVLRWDGCEYIYKSSMIFDSEEEIVEYISRMTLEKFYEQSESGRALISSRYSPDHFISSVVSIFGE